MTVTEPKNPPEHAHRGVDCERAMGPAFQEAIVEALAAGWTEAEAAEAMLELARNHIAGMLADQYMDMDIEAAARAVA